MRVRDPAFARRAESSSWENILTEKKELGAVPARNFSANSRMDFVSAKSSFFTMTCWFPVSVRISLAAASAFAMSLQATTTLAPIRGGESRNRSWDHWSTLGDQGYGKQADCAQCLHTRYCFCRELASVRSATRRDKALPTTLLAPIQPRAVIRPRKSTSEAPLSSQVLPGQEYIPQQCYEGITSATITGMSSQEHMKTLEFQPE